MSLRILTLVHSHISTSFGGSEHAAFALHHAYQKNNEAWILTPISPLNRPISDRDAQVTCRSHPITMSCTNADQRNQELKPLLEHIQPQIIHLHHYLNFGIDIFKTLEKLCPYSKIVLTLHEYLLLCAHNGQMLKRRSNRICKNPSPEACTNCFPELDQTYLSSKFLAQATIDSCDGLITPSHWLLEVMQKSSITSCRTSDRNGLPNSLLSRYTRDQARRTPQHHASIASVFLAEPVNAKGCFSC